MRAWDANCNQHIQQRFTEGGMGYELAVLRNRIGELEAELAAVRREPAGVTRAGH